MVRVLHLRDVLLWQDFQRDLALVSPVVSPDDPTEVANANLLENFKLRDHGLRRLAVMILLALPLRSIYAALNVGSDGLFQFCVYLLYDLVYVMLSFGVVRR